MSSSDWNFRGGMTVRYVCLVKSTLVRSATVVKFAGQLSIAGMGPSKVSRLSLKPTHFWPEIFGLSRMPPFLCGTMCGARGAVAGDMDGSWRSVYMMLCVCVLVLVCYPLNYQFDVVLIHHECRSLTGTLGVCSIVFCMFAIYPRVKTEMNATKLSLSPRSESTLATWSPSMWQAWSVPLGETVSVVLCYHWLPSFNIEVPIIKGSLGGETSVLRTFRMSGKELVKERVSKERVRQGKS